MNKGTKTLVFLALMVAMASVAVGQQSLKDLITEEGFAWMAGRWQGSTDDGQEITLSYRWAVNGHAVISDFKMGEVESHGMIYLDATDGTVKQFSVDSRGRTSTSIWDTDGERVIAKTKMTGDDGQAVEVAVAYSQVDKKTMKVSVYSLENGQPAADPWFESEFKRQARPAEAATRVKKDKPADSDKPKRRKKQDN